jgi:hypothetical protein
MLMLNFRINQNRVHSSDRLIRSSEVNIESTNAWQKKSFAETKPYPLERMVGSLERTGTQKTKKSLF